MSKSSLLLLLAGFIGIQLSAQVTTERTSMSEGVYEALVLQIPDLNAKQTGNIWADFTKDYYGTRSKYNRKASEYIASGASIAALGKGSEVNLHAAIAENGNGSTIKLWVNLGDEFLSQSAHPDRYMEAEKIMLRFGLEGAKEKIRMDIADQEKQLERLMGDLKKLQNDKEREERAIEKAQQAIADAEAAIEKNGTDQTAKNEEIEAQQALIEATKVKLNDI